MEYANPAYGLSYEPRGRIYLFFSTIAARPESHRSVNICVKGQGNGAPTLVYAFVACWRGCEACHVQTVQVYEYKGAYILHLGVATRNVSALGQNFACMMNACMGRFGPDLGGW